MSGPLSGLRIGFLERPHPPDHRGGLAERLVPLLREFGAFVEIVHAERGLHRLDVRPSWDLVVLKSGSAAALHLAAAAEGWRIPSLNSVEATRLAQDKLASAAILQRAGAPIARSRLTWLEGGTPAPDLPADRALIIKAARGSQGEGLWNVAAGGLSAAIADLPSAPYLVMERVEHGGDDLKVFVAGVWMEAIERPFPARTLEEKLGRRVPVPVEVGSVARQVGATLGLSCFGCDFVLGPHGWTLVDVNAFPGYKGAAGAPAAIAAEIVAVAPKVSLA